MIQSWKLQFVLLGDFSFFLLFSHLYRWSPLRLCTRIHDLFCLLTNFLLVSCPASISNRISLVYVFCFFRVQESDFFCHFKDAKLKIQSDHTPSFPPPVVWSIFVRVFVSTAFALTRLSFVQTWVSCPSCAVFLLFFSLSLVLCQTAFGSFKLCALLHILLEPTCIITTNHLPPSPTPQLTLELSVFFVVVSFKARFDSLFLIFFYLNYFSSRCRFTIFFSFHLCVWKLEILLKTVEALNDFWLAEPIKKFDELFSSIFHLKWLKLGQKSVKSTCTSNVFTNHWSCLFVRF